MTMVLRALFLVVCFIIVTAFYALSKEFFPPSGLIGGIRGVIALILLYGAWKLSKKINFETREPRDPSYNSMRYKKTSEPSVKEKDLPSLFLKEPKDQPPIEEKKHVKPSIDQKTTNQKNMANSETEEKGLRVIKDDIGARGVKIIGVETEDGSQMMLQTPWLNFKEMLAYTGLTVEDFETLSKAHPLAHGGNQDYQRYNVNVIDKWLKIKRD